MNNEMFLESEEDASCSGAAPECSRTVRILDDLQEVKQVLDLFHEYEYYYDFQNIPALQMSLNGPMI